MTKQTRYTTPNFPRTVAPEIPRPSVGRIVHYYTDGDLTHPQAAIITHVMPPSPMLRVHLTTFPAHYEAGEALRAALGVPFCEVPADGCWCWPPRI
jgi:hypothetical protein